MELGQCVLRCGVEPPAHQLPVDLQPGLWEPFLIPATPRSLKSESSAPSCIEAALIYPCDNRGQAQKGLYGLNAAFGADSSWECPWSSLRARWECGTRLQAESRDFRKQYPSWTLHETDNKQPAQIPPGNAQFLVGMPKFLVGMPKFLQERQSLALLGQEVEAAARGRSWEMQLLLPLGQELVF